METRTAAGLQTKIPFKSDHRGLGISLFLCLNLRLQPSVPPVSKVIDLD